MLTARARAAQRSSSETFRRTHRTKRQRGTVTATGVNEPDFQVNALRKRSGSRRITYAASARRFVIDSRDLVRECKVPVAGVHATPTPVVAR